MQNPENDPIVAEVRRERELHTMRLQCDVSRIFAEIREQQRVGERDFVQLVPRRASLQMNVATEE
jgi:hypothetical protein